MMRSSEPSSAPAGTPLMKSIVRAMRARSSSNVCSLSSNFGASTPARRDTPNLLISDAICTWRVSGNMSGARRAASSKAGSYLRATACAWPLSSRYERFARLLASRSTDAAWTEIFMGSPGEVAGTAGGAYVNRRKAWRACPSGETISSRFREIASSVSQLWTPAQLAVLAKVVDLNGFSSAARALGVPKAAVSRAIADLEQSLGVRLLERTTRRLALTAAGRLLY